METIVMDIDGVLADNSNYKNWFDKSGDFIPEKFEEEILNFKANTWAKELIRMGSERLINIVILTSRREAFREKTIQWLENNNIYYDQLSTNDEKEDFVQHKLSVLKDLKSDGYKILFIVEDNPEIVKAEREEGYVVLQPNNLYGDYDE